MDAIKSVRAIKAEKLLVADVAKFHVQIGGISEWLYPPELARNTIALAIDDSGEYALMVDCPEVDSLLESHGLETVDFSAGPFGDGDQGTVELLEGSTWVVVEGSQRFSDEFCEQWGI